jgi:hypothetical protein
MRVSVSDSNERMGVAVGAGERENMGLDVVMVLVEGIGLDMVGGERMVRLVVFL